MLFVLPFVAIAWAFFAFAPALVPYMLSYFIVGGLWLAFWRFLFNRFGAGIQNRDFEMVAVGWFYTWPLAIYFGALWNIQDSLKQKRKP